MVISIKAGDAMNDSCSDDANSYICIAKVSKLNGLNIRVAGNSLTISTKTRIKAVMTVVFIIGIWIFFKIIKFEKPKDLAVRSILFFILLKPDSVALNDIVENLTKYAIRSAMNEPLR